MYFDTYRDILYCSNSLEVQRHYFNLDHNLVNFYFSTNKIVMANDVKSSSLVKKNAKYFACSYYLMTNYKFLLLLVIEKWVL